MATPTNDQIKEESLRRKRLLTEYMNSAEYQERLKQRIAVNDACNNSLEAQAYTWKLCERKDNPVEGCIFFIENFLWTFNPKEEPKHFPFILFDFQKVAVREFIEHIDNGRDLMLEKSREMGASWLLFSAVTLWYWLFRDGINFLVGSYKEDLVDNKTVDSLVGKVNYEIELLPKWILPKEWNEKKHRTHMKVMNPDNGNLITGDTMNPNFGRGSRKTAILFDELGFWQYAKDAWESAGDSTNCRIAVSTPNGDNYFHRLKKTGVDVLTLHWKLHPLKDYEWYRYECSRRTEEEIAQELDISYTRSKEGRVYPEWNETNVIKGLYEYDDNLPLYVSWDFGRTDDTAIIWAQPSRDGLRIIDTYRNNNKNIDFYVPFITGHTIGSSQYNYTEEELDLIFSRRNWKRATHYGDPAGRFQNNVTNETVIDILKQYGIIVNFRDAWKEFKLRKPAAKRLIMNRILLNDNKRTDYFDTCMINSAYPQVKVNGVPEVRSEKPAHDNNSHYRSSFEYLALGLEGVSEKFHVKPFDKFPKKDVATRVWGANKRTIRY